ncbi:DNA polymerase III subunit beta [Candidatus Peregrinibacteria bacterium HGW-Peregrinibacteria-1]|nr:MAG: DNA polymerase III subunit beta [Candidatus Peregrinibacteria bacterium HGW-Peregrinibacteria-1]
MKFLCKRRDLDYALNVVSKAISPNNTLPVLNNILIRAEGNQVFFSATNLEIAISCHVDADIKAEGKTTVPAKLITSYVALLTDEQLELHSGASNVLEINSTTSNTKINCISAEEFPLIPKVDKDIEFMLNVDDLGKAINETVFAASMNASRPVLTGVYFASMENGVKLVATDSYRLAESKIDLGNSFNADFKCVVPGRTLMELGKILMKAEAKGIKINISNNQILFSVDGVELISRLIDGQFPDYNKIISNESKTVFKVKVEDISLVVKRVSLFARENNNSVKLNVEGDGKLLVKSEETKVGEEKGEVLIESTGENNSIALNAQYLLDVLSYIGDDKVEIKLNDRTSPAHIKPVDRDNYLYIIMPLKVS